MPPRASRRREVRSSASEDDGTAAIDWRDETLTTLRAVILASDPTVVEEVKWRKPSNPDGVPVWSYEGILCIGNTLKSSVRLTFPKGAQIPDPKRLFNTRLDSRTVRAIDYHKGGPIDPSALRALIRHAIALNLAKSKQ